MVDVFLHGLIKYGVLSTSLSKGIIYSDYVNRPSALYANVPIRI